MAEKSIFKKIIDRDLAADIVHEDQVSLAFRDINPQAPLHIVVIPKKEIPSIDDLSEQDGEIVGHLLIVVRNLARNLGLRSGYRVVVNCGADGGQTVNHLHFHLLGGRTMQWPPG
jgi:histidine triad (HIT) family protein